MSFITTTCPICGADVGDIDLHQAWHKVTPKKWAEAVERRRQVVRARLDTMAAQLDQIREQAKKP